MTEIEKCHEEGQEPVRRFFMIAEVTFRDRPEESPADTNYYSDDQLADMVDGWVSDALDDRDDSPSVRFHDVPNDLLLRAIRTHVKWAERQRRRNDRANWREEKDPGRLAWGYVIEQNTSGGLDTDDLISALERAGVACPAEWVEGL